MKKRPVLLCGFLLFTLLSFAQTQGDTTVPPKDTNRQAPVTPRKDTVRRVPPPAKRKTDSAAIRRADSLRTAQRIDTLARRKDSLQAVTQDTLAKDSVAVVKPPVINTRLIRYITVFQAALLKHPYYNFAGKPIVMQVRERQGSDKDGLFYFLVGLFLYFALIRLFFTKYMNNIMTLFFRVTMRQQQIREQLLQLPLASLLLNILFVITGGLFMAFVAQYYNISPVKNFWLLAGYCSAILIIIYSGKFILLKIVGWIFNVRAATDTYIFIIFLVNKMIGIFLLPVLLLMAFPYPPLYSVVLTLAYIMLALFLGYRFIISYKPIRNEIKVSRFHFFLYLCAFEIAPLLLIYKVLLIFVERSY